MSAGTFTDENGQVFVVAPDGKLRPATNQSIAQQAKKQAKDIALNQGKKAIATQIEKNLPTAAAVGNLLTGSSGAAAEGLSSGLASSEAANAAWNADAMAATPGSFDLAGIGSEGNVLLPAAGLAGAYDLYANRPENIGTGKGYLQGAASGAAIGSYFGPVGAAIGGGVGLLGNALGIGHKSRTKVEEEARKQLASQGINIPNQDIKEWENNAKFKASRNEADLTGKDIIHAASLYGIGGYDKLDPAKQEAIANEALKQGLVREHHGTIQIGMNDAYQKFLDEQLKGGNAGSGNRNATPRPTFQRDPRVEKEKKRQQIAQIIPELESTPTQAPRYDINLSSLMSNPYL